MSRKVCTLLLTSRYVDRIAGSALGARQDPQSLFNLRLIVQNHSQPTSVVGPVSAVNGWAEHVGSARYFRRQLVQLWPHHRSQRLNENFSPRHGPAMVAIIKFGASWLTDNGAIDQAAPPRFQRGTAIGFGLSSSLAPNIIYCEAPTRPKLGDKRAPGTACRPRASRCRE